MAQGRTSRRGQRRWDRWLAVPSPATLAFATILLAAADRGARLSGDTVFPGGPLDELAHLLTTLLVMWALGAQARVRVLVPALIASVAIDADHIPGRLGNEWLTAGTQRPHTHSLLMLGLMVAVALLRRRRRDVVIGVAIGLAIHFWRDMGEGGGGVSLLWPISYHSFQYPHDVYVAVMAVFVSSGVMHCTIGKRSIDRAIRRRRQRHVPETL